MVPWLIGRLASDRKDAAACLERAAEEEVLAAEVGGEEDDGPFLEKAAATATELAVCPGPAAEFA